MKRFPFIFAAILLLSNIAICQSQPLVDTKAMDSLVLRVYNTRLDSAWQEDWVLLEYARMEIDEFVPGFILRWGNVDGSVEKTEYYDLTGQLQRIYERRFENGIVTKRGNIQLDENGRPKWAGLAVLHNNSGIFSSLDQVSVSHYEFEIYENGEICGIYTSHSNQIPIRKDVPPESRLGIEVPEDLELVGGRDCLGLLN